MSRVVYLGGYAEGYIDQVAGSGWFTCGIGDYDPPTDPSAANAYLFPLQLPLRTAMKWFWKVKRWRLEWDFVVLGVPSSGSEDSVAAVSGERELFTQNGLTYGYALGAVFTYANQQFNTYKGVYQTGEQYRPQIAFAIPTGNFASTNPAFGPLVGQLEIDGFATTIPIYSGNPDVTLADFVLTPIEYWPYAKYDGTEPIYDSSDGSELLNPFDYQDPLA